MFCVLFSCQGFFLSFIIYIRIVGDDLAKRKKKNQKLKRRMLFLGFGSIIVITITVFSIGKYWVEIYQKYKEKQELEQKLYSLKEEEDALKVDVERLQDPEYVARYAREKYYYSKDGEFILRIP